MCFEATLKTATDIPDLKRVRNGSMFGTLHQVMGARGELESTKKA